VALGRAGCGVPVKANLAFQAAHAGARDAVRAALNVEALRAAIASHGWQSVAITSAAVDRDVYLKHPELGRALSEESKRELSAPMVAPDIAIVLGDGLSAIAVERNAVAVLAALLPKLAEAGLKVGPIVVATQARVALADQVGEIMQARLAIMLIGERPGLSAVDSLGMYLTYAPKSGRVDSERHCISNIHAGGLSAAAAAEQAAELVKLMLLHRCSGVALNGKIGKVEAAPPRVGSSKK
jgi:ethanolamine ammonia-lyase small subunit